MRIFIQSFITVVLILSLASCKTGPSVKKATRFPNDVWKVPKDNDYQNPGSMFSVSRMIETENLVALWTPEFGNDPSVTDNEKMRFPIHELMEETDKMFVFYRDELKFVEKGKSHTDSLRMLMHILWGDEGTVYGGGADKKIGVTWLYPGRIKSAPFCAMAHELGHSFQYQVEADGNWGFSSAPEGGKAQAIWEMTSQYMLWQFYPDWITVENYHLNTFMKNTHLAFLHEDVRYSSPFVLEYWASKHGNDIIGRLWREAKKGEDPVIVYKRMTGIDQKIFNDEIFDASRRFITWDMERIREASKKYTNQHSSEFTQLKDGWYEIAESRCPQNYGYNGIRLEVPVANTGISLHFKGIAGAKNFRAINPDKAGWRYGFLAVTKEGERIYGDMHTGSESRINFTCPENTGYLWLIVSGAPTEHWEHVWDDNVENDEQWPYQIKLQGTTLHNSVVIQ